MNSKIASYKLEKWTSPHSCGPQICLAIGQTREDTLTVRLAPKKLKKNKKPSAIWTLKFKENRNNPHSLEIINPHCLDKKAVSLAPNNIPGYTPVISGRPLNLPERYYHVLIIYYVNFTRSIVSISEKDSFCILSKHFNANENTLCRAFTISLRPIP